jgi:hypothetical protein
VLNHTLLELSTYVLADHLHTLEKRVVFEFPASPWQHVKARLAARVERNGYALESRHGRRTRDTRGPVQRLVQWWLRRHPIRNDYRAMHVSFTEEAIFPDARLRFPRDQRGVKVARMASYPDELLGDKGLRALNRLDVTIDDEPEHD